MFIELTGEDNEPVLVSVFNIQTIKPADGAMKLVREDDDLTKPRVKKPIEAESRIKLIEYDNHGGRRDPSGRGWGNIFVKETPEEIQKKAEVLGVKPPSHDR